MKRADHTVSIVDEVRRVRVNEARAALSQGDRYMRLHPASTGSPVIQQLRHALQNLLTEIEHPTTTPTATGVKKK